MTREKVLEAVKPIRTGEVVSLGMRPDRDIDQPQLARDERVTVRCPQICSWRQPQ